MFEINTIYLYENFYNLILLFEFYVKKEIVKMFQKNILICAKCHVVTI